MDDFYMREVSEETSDGLFRVTRTRSSKGHASISVRLDGVRCLIFDNKNNGSEYEQKAFELAKVLEKIASEPCTLPKEMNNG
jgi:hypothetical protein